MYALILISMNQHKKLKVRSFTIFKNMIWGPKF